MHTSNTFKTVVLLSGPAGFMVLIGTLLGGTAGLMQMALSKSREFEADRIGARSQVAA